MEYSSSDSTDLESLQALTSKYWSFCVMPGPERLSRLLNHGELVTYYNSIPPQFCKPHLLPHQVISDERKETCESLFSCYLANLKCTELGYGVFPLNKTDENHHNRNHK